MCVKRVMEKTIQVKILAIEQCHHDLAWFKVLGGEIPRCNYCGEEINVGDFEVQMIVGDELKAVVYYCSKCLQDAFGDFEVTKTKKCWG